MDRWFSGGWLSGGWLAGGSQGTKEEGRPSLDETISSELFAEGKGDQEKSGLKDNDSDCAKGPACFKEEENSERIHHVEGPDVDRGLEENACDEKFIVRLKVVADNQSKEWESTSPREGEWVNKYPQRSKEPDCIYYVITGNCRHGANCKFNHHSHIDEQASTLNIVGPEKATGETIKEVPERVRQKEFKVVGETIKEVPERVRHKELKEENCERIHHLEGPDVNRGFEENASDGKFIERLKVVADNQNKEWESTSPREGEWVNKYPQRSNEPDCIYYVRTGNCWYGANCKFNHHSHIDEQASPLNTVGPEKLHTVTGCYKSGSAFKHGHGLDSEKIGTTLELNFSGLPLRPGMSECPYYMRTGSCKFAINCRFHHPNPTLAGENFLSVNGNGGSPQLASGASQMPWMSKDSKPFEKNSDEPVSSSNASNCNLPTILFPPHELHPTSDSSNYQPQMHECHERPSECMFHHPSSSTSSGSNVTKSEVENKSELKKIGKNRRCQTSRGKIGGKKGYQTPMAEYPQRPGEPECSYFMKHGSCKFRYACKFHHPSASTLCDSTRQRDGQIQQMEQYPERPGEPECTLFMKFRSCKLKSACKFHNPKFHIPTRPPCITRNGLPLRPDKPVCFNYRRSGICKFGPRCNFDHPIDFGLFPSEAAMNSSQVPTPSEFGTGLGKAAVSNIDGQDSEW